ncbi:MAG: HEAT repeat domain-containing protein [Planctomycetota bacterium]|nr:MAG: HEAT repeat domain-containing protein [Planctomycetota bacterium]
MKSNLSLKLGFFVILLFALLITGMFTYPSIRYRILESRLQSNDSSVRKKAIIALSGYGHQAIPRIRDWLQSGNKLLVVGSCQALDGMKGNTWKDALPELKQVLGRPPSAKTDAAAALIYKKGYACTPGHKSEGFLYLNWNSLWQPAAKRNLCIHIISNKIDDSIRKTAAYTLGEIGDPAALKYLVKLLKNESDPIMRMYVSEALGKIGDDRAGEPLLEVFKNESDYRPRDEAGRALSEIGGSRIAKMLLEMLVEETNPEKRRSIINVLGKTGEECAVESLIALLKKPIPKSFDRNAAALALGRMGDKRAVKPLLELLGKVENMFLRREIIGTLAQVRDERAVDPLIALLETGSRYDIESAARALGLIGNTRAVAPLINVLEGDYFTNPKRSAINALGRLGATEAISSLAKILGETERPRLRTCAAVALANIEGESVNDILRSSLKNGNNYAAIALGWRNGGPDLAAARNIRAGESYYHLILGFAEASWGKVNYISNVIGNCYGRNTPHWLVEDVLMRMPEECPKFDFKANYSVRDKQAKTMMEWYKENKSRLAWDPGKQRYYLKKE